MHFRLSRRALLRGFTPLLAAASIPVVAPSLRLRAAKGLDARNDLKVTSTFYVSASGSDEADGRSPATAWSTIQRANQAPTSSRLLLRRGDTFYGELDLPRGCELGAYGEGDRPILTMYKLLNQPGGWVASGEDVWKIDLGSSDTHGGYNVTRDANIGFLMVDGVVKAQLKFSMSELSSTWDFYCDVSNYVLYIKVPANPTELALDIRAATNGTSFGVSGSVVYCQYGINDIHDIHITGSGGCGIRGSGANVRVSNCLIDYIGGALLAGYGDGKTRYGNAIEHWLTVSNWTIENNEIAEVYDAAWSPQGSDDAGGIVYWKDLTVRGNHIHDCGQMFEIWSENNNPSSPGFVRVLIEGNRCERGGYGAFAEVRPNQTVRVHLLTYRLQTPVDVTIQNNLFADAYGSYCYHYEEPPSGFVTRNNTITLRAGQKIEYQRVETVEQADVWKLATGREVGSTIIAVPRN